MKVGKLISEKGWGSADSHPEPRVLSVIETKDRFGSFDCLFRFTVQRPASTSETNPSPLMLQAIHTDTMPANRKKLFEIGNELMSDDKSTTPNFESLLRTDFRWPTVGDTPFTRSPKWDQNAYIDPYGHSRLVMMMTGYKNAADLAVAHVAQDRHEGDALVFPAVFNYRQFIELSLKYLIATYGYTVGVPADWNTHDLGTLWCTFMRVLEGYGHDDVEGTDSIVEAIILEFAKVDPRSFSYRYPVDTKGKLVNLAHNEIDLHGLADVMHGLDGYFSGCDGYLDELQRAGP